MARKCPGNGAKRARAVRENTGDTVVSICRKTAHTNPWMFELTAKSTGKYSGKDD